MYFTKESAKAKALEILQNNSRLVQTGCAQEVEVDVMNRRIILIFAILKIKANLWLDGESADMLLRRCVEQVGRQVVLKPVFQEGDAYWLECVRYNQPSAGKSQVQLTN